MMQSLLIILSNAEHQQWANELFAAANPVKQLALVGSPAQAANHLASHTFSPSCIVIDIGDRGSDILAEIDALAQQCEPGTKVIAVGNANDIHLYRAMLARGILDYLPMPANIETVVTSLTREVMPAVVPQSSSTSSSSNGKRVIAFMSAASGDGGSTIALNTAYAISQIEGGKTILVDIDYQYGMVAKNLALQNQYGIRDLFDHPERGVDEVLIRRMVVKHNKLDVITAPAELNYLPLVDAQAIQKLITILRANYDNVILDLPHVWLPWVATAAQQSTRLILVAQLWLKSVSHAARMMRALREIGILPNRVTAVINRSGAKFKEAIDAKDFERVCATPISHSISNDIKTVVAAEAGATTIMQLPPSPLADDISNLARDILGMPRIASTSADKRSGLFSKIKG